MESTRVEDIYPLSPMQRGMLFHLLYQQGSRAYFNQIAFTIDLALDDAAFARALELTLARHPILRSSLHWEDIEKPLQVVFRTVPLPLEHVDLRDLDDAAQGERLHSFMQVDRTRGFELATAPLVRLTLLRLGPKTYRVVFSYLHVLLEGFSALAVLLELFQTYDAVGRGEAPKLPQLRSYRDYIAWLEQQDSAKDEAFWRGVLKGFEATTSFGPGDRAPSRQASVSLRFREVSSHLPPAIGVALQEFARANRLTLNTLYQAAWAILLARYAESDDVVFGATVSGRSAPIEGIEEMLGLFINTLPVRVRYRPEEPLVAWLLRLQAEQAEARQHEHTPLVHIMGWSGLPRGLPLFESNLVFENLPFENLPSRSDTLVPRDYLQSDEQHYALNIVVAPGSWHNLLVYDCDRFSDEDAARRLAHLGEILAGFVAKPGIRVGDVAMLTPSERQQVLVDWNRTQVEVPASLLVHELFEAQVARTPDAIAVACDQETLSYRQLDRRANQLANHLRALGVRPESKVGVLLEQSLELFVALLGVLKAGGAYVPFDAQIPGDRLAYVIEDAAMQVVITLEALSGELPSSRTLHVVELDTQASTIAACAETKPTCGARPDALAYVVYTSGSTGEPKGVLVEHRSVVNHNVVVADRFGLVVGDRVLQFTPINFDAAVEEIFPPFARGATVVVRRELVPASDFRGLVEREGLTVLSLPPVYLHEWVTELERLGETVPACLRLVLLGGDKIRPESYALWRKVGGARVPWINVYGPTEATVTSAMCVIEGEDALALPVLPMGGPIGNARIYLLDGSFQPVPVGHPGEVLIAGAGLARGYLGRADETAEKFVPDPFSTTPGARMYRTRDLATHRADGRLEFVGRADHQVKLRGFRIELGEIEATLRKHPGVGDAVVLLRRDGDEPRLAAYVAVDPALVLSVPSSLELRELLKQTLPDYMLPSAYVVLPALPLTANGKVDRKALPEPDWMAPERHAEYVAPRNAVEEVIVGIWAEILGVEKVGVLDDFFELGGHSLAATQVISRVRTAFQSEVPLSVMFDDPTVSGLAAVLQASAGGGAPPIVPVPRDRPLVLSSAQERLWFVHQLEPTDSSYHVPIGLDMTGELDRVALKRAIDQMVRQHETLRTSYTYADGQTTQKIQPSASVDVALPVESVEHLAIDAQYDHLAQRSREETNAPIDLSTGPVVRARLFVRGKDRHLLLIVVHHIAIDGWAENLFMRDLSLAYDALASGRPSPLTPPTLQYADYAAWQRGYVQGEVRDKLIAYWKGKLSGGLAPLDLPADFPRPSAHSYSGAMHFGEIPATLAESLRALCRKESSTLFMAILAAFKALCGRYAGQDDVVVITDAANRDQAATEEIVGFFVNQLVLRTNVGGNPTFRELIHRVRETALGAYAHQELDFEEVIRAVNPERLPGDHSPIFRLKLAVVPNLPGQVPTAARLQVDRFLFKMGKAQNDIYLIIDDDGVRLTSLIHYRTDLFREDTVVRFWGHFLRLLDGFVARPDEPIGFQPMLGDAERTEVIDTWNATAQDVPADALVHQLFEAQAARTPDACAVRFSDEALTYRELDERANQLAHHLRAQGVGPDVLVGVCLDPALECIVALLGVLKAGGAYVPVDPTAPEERLATIFTGAGVRIVLTQKHLAAALPQGAWRALSLDSDWPLINREPRTRTQTVTRPNNLAYVVYTSGSTGEPKGVLVEHRSVVNHNAVVVKQFGLGPTDRVLQFTPLYFDAAVEEIFPPLASGGSLVVRGDLVPAYEFSALIEREGLTVLSLPPTYLHEWVAELDRDGARVPSVLRLVLIGGEKIHPESYALWRRVGGEKVPWINVYGPTEATVTSAAYRIEGEEALAFPILPIGGPIGNARIYLLDRALEPVPIDHPGELFIAGAGLARGYLGRPAETAERFLPDPYSRRPGGRMYRTSDVARHRRDGAVEFLGRADDQVKLRGFRIELGEIESCLRKHTSIQDAVVLVRADGNGEPRLAAWVVIEAGGPAPTAWEIREHLKKSLPDYMVPSAFAVLDALPLTANGKVDKHALPEPEVAGHLTALITPRTRTELELVEIWQELLGGDVIGVNHDFFALGGHSMLAIRMMARVKQAFETEIPLATLFELPTIEHLARALDAERNKTGPRPWSPLVPIQPKGTRRPFFCVHPAGGSVFCYYLLATRLGPDQPFYGLQAFGQAGTGIAPLRTFEDMADAYLEEVRKVQPHGPYQLGGWSSGGPIALEMAQRLRKAGEEVSLLVMFDVTSSSLLRGAAPDPVQAKIQRLLLEEPAADRVSGVFAYAQLGGDFDEAFALPADQPDVLWQKVVALSASRPDHPVEYGERELKEHAGMLTATMRAAYSYRELPYGGKIDVFASRGSLREWGEPTLGWRSVAPDTLALHVVDGDHLSLMSSPFVEPLAEALRAVLAGGADPV